MTLKVLDLFSGIGGFSLGLERTGGFETVAFCEINQFAQKVLSKHWPNVEIFDDVKDVTNSTLLRRGISTNVITGGFPCQDISIAGKKQGIKEGTRSGLWSEIVRLVGEVLPKYVIVENVTNLLIGPSERPGGWFGRILGDLAELGYNAEWRVLRGYDVGVPQARPRVWIVAYPARFGTQKILHQDTLDAFGFAPWMDGQGRKHANVNHKNSGKGTLPVLGYTVWSEIFNRRGGGDNERLSVGLDRYKALGNTVIPQIPELIGRAILEAARSAPD